MVDGQGCSKQELRNGGDGGRRMAAMAPWALVQGHDKFGNAINLP